VPTEAIGRNPVRWLFDTYETVRRAKYQSSIARISEMELAMLRALAQFHSKKGRKLPPLPTYEQCLVIEEQMIISATPKKPAWMIKYEEVNKRKMEIENGEEPPRTDG